MPPYDAANPSLQLGWRSVQPSPRFAFAFEAPRTSVIIATPVSPTSSRASHAGTRRGGGAHGAVRTPVEGSLRVARFLIDLGRVGERQGVEMALTWVNGQPGAVAYLPGGPVVSTMILEIVDGKVTGVQAVVNPEKLQHVALPR